MSKPATGIRFRFRLNLWKCKRRIKSLKYHLKYVLDGTLFYPTLLISSFIIYAELVFFHAFFFGNYFDFHTAVNGSLKAIVQAFSSFYALAYILVIYIVIALIVFIFRFNRGIIIEKFTEDEEKERKQQFLHGPIHDLLSHELNRIFKLYSDVDTKRPISTTLNVVSSPFIGVRVEDISKSMGEVISDDSSISLGPFKIPLRFILAFTSQFFSGRKIQGSLLNSDSGIIIVASMAGAKPPRTWKIECKFVPGCTGNTQNPTPSGGDNSKNYELVNEMIEILACRIFSDLTEFQSFRWEATRDFMRGIECYRECLLSPGEKIVKLKEAEKYFTEALSKDITFSSAWFNLGVIYTELHFLEAARNAYYKSFTRERTKGNAYFGLALNYYNTHTEAPRYGLPSDATDREQSISNLQDAVFFCEQARCLLKNNPEILLLKGRLNLELYYLADCPYQVLSTKELHEKKTDYLDVAIDDFNRAVGSSYSRWYEEEFKNLGKADDTLNFEETRHRNLFRERLGELGWAYLEYAAREKYLQGPPVPRETTPGEYLIDPIREKRCRDALDSALRCFYEALFGGHFSIPAPLTEDYVDQAINMDIADALLFWKCGILQLCRGDDRSAEVLLSRALVMDPMAFLYQASHILGKIFPDGSFESNPAVIYWTHALQHAKNAYDKDKLNRDYQWNYLADAVTLIGIFRYPGQHKSMLLASSAPPGDLNRFTPLTRIYSPEKCRDFGKFLRTIFNIYEIFSILESRHFTKTCIEFLEDGKDKMIPGDKDILKIFKKRLNQKSGFGMLVPDDVFFGYLSDHEDWIKAHYYLAICPELEKLSKFNLALEIWGKALDCLKRYPLEIGYRGTIAAKTNTLLNLNYHREALSDVWKAHWIDPMSYFEHAYLGQCAAKISDFDTAIQAWEEGVRLNPKQSLISITNLAITYLRRANNYPYYPGSPTNNQQDAYLAKARDYLMRAIQIAEHEFQSVADETRYKNLDNLIALRFWLGRVYQEQGQYAGASEQFMIVKNLAQTCQNVRETDLPMEELDRFLPSAYHLGCTLVKQGKLTDAETVIREMLSIPQLSEILPVLQPNTILELSDIQKKFLKEPCGGKLFIRNLNYRDILIYTLLLRAWIDIERSGSLESLEKLIVPIRSLIKKMADDPASSLPCRPRAPEASLYREICAEIEKTYGFYHLKSGGDGISSLNTAIQFFRSAIQKQEDPESYFFIFSAQHRILQVGDQPPAKNKKGLSDLLNTSNSLKKTGIPRDYAEEYMAIESDLKKWLSS